MAAHVIPPRVLASRVPYRNEDEQPTLPEETVSKLYGANHRALQDQFDTRRLAVTEAWPNCPRYVHRYQKVQASRYVPRAECATPLAGWKRIDIIQQDLPAKDQGRADREGGVISIEDSFGKVAQGDPEA